MDEKWLRATLWVSFPFNLVAAYILAFPSSAPGQLVGLPATVPALYAALTSFLVALFGVVYAWLAIRPRINRPLVAVSAIGKTGVFGIACVLWIAGSGAGRVVLLASGDLALAFVWFWWLIAATGEDGAAERVT